MVLGEERNRAVAVKTTVEQALAHAAPSEGQHSGQDSEGNSTRRPHKISVISKPTLERSMSDGVGRVGAFEVQVRPSAVPGGKQYVHLPFISCRRSAS